MSVIFKEPVRSQSLVDKIVERIEQAIMSGDLRGGERLSEYRLATQLGVSRGPLREALSKLEGRRLVKRVPNIGTQVVGATPQDLREILIVREALEGAACRLATRNLTDDEIRELSELVDKQEAELEKSETPTFHRSANLDFHLRIIRASGNNLLIKLLCEDLFYLLKVHRYRSAAVPGRAKQAFAEHRAVIAAFNARDAEGAENAMRRHLRNSYETLLDSTGDIPVDESDQSAPQLIA